MRSLALWPIRALAVSALLGGPTIGMASGPAAFGAESGAATATQATAKSDSLSLRTASPGLEPTSTQRTESGSKAGDPKPMPGSKPSPNDDPSLSEMNATHNHSMGSTLAKNDPAAVNTTSARTFQTFAAAGPSTYVWGLDVSGWQVLTASDWQQIWANGARFAYVKATESTDYVSSQFSEQYTDSYNAGLAHGAYHFATPDTSSGAAQANFFVDHGGGWMADGRTLPPLLDIEYDPYSANACYGLSQAAMVSWIADFSNTVQSRTGRLPAIYTTTDWWTQCTGNTGRFSANPLFIARWGRSVSDGPGTLPTGWETYAFWQTGDTGTFPGDQDLFNGSLDDLRKFALDASVPGGLTNATDPPFFGVGDLNGDGKPDLIAKKPDGTLWFYAGWGDAAGRGYAAGQQIGTGWDMFSEVIGPGDLNGDGKPDVIARKPDGTLWLYAGTGAVGGGQGALRTGVKIGFGWTLFRHLIGVGDLDRDDAADLVAVKDDGTLWFYHGTGTASGSSPYFSAGQKLETPGVTGSDILAAAGDLNGDGYPDLVARTPSGWLEFIGGGGHDAVSYRPGQLIGVSGWSSFTDVIGVNDFNGDGTADLIAQRGDGTLWFYDGTGTAGTGSTAYQPARQIGYAGWNMFVHLIAAGDINGDGTRDLLAVKRDGTLWLYPGTGVVDAAHNGLGPPIQVGSGWQPFPHVISGDFNGDGKPDLLATRSDGTLWFFAGTQQTSGPAAYYRPSVQAGSGWNIFNALVAGDTNGDGYADIVARRSDGTLWTYRGTGPAGSSNAGFRRGIRAGTGWNIFDAIIGVYDSNGDGVADLAAIRPDGTLWFYAGTGRLGGVVPAFASPVPIGPGWNIFG